jgi:CHAT domain-containing protein
LLITHLVRELNLGPPQPGNDSSIPGAASAAILDGEPGRLHDLLTGHDLDQLPDEVGRALRSLDWYLRNRWFPGPTGGTVDDEEPMPPQPAPSTDDLDLFWIADVLPTSLALRNLVTGARRAGEANAAIIFANVAHHRIEEWIRVVGSADEPAAAGHVALLVADIARRAGLTELTRSALDDAGRMAEGWPPLRGAHRTAEGDALLAPRHSVETLGLDLDERATPAVIGSTADRELAAEHYRAARQAFVDAAAPRGVAAVALRLAWLARLTGDHHAARTLLEAAIGGFADAGDGAGRMLALTHLAVADLAAGRLSATRPGPAVDLVGWAAGPGSRSFALGCAGLVHATACAFRDAGAVEPALAAFDLARRSIRALGDRGAEIALISDLGELYARLNSRGATIATAEDAVADMMAPYGGFDAAGELEVVDWMRLLDLLMTLSNQYQLEQDVDGIVGVGQRLLSLLQRAPGGPRTPVESSADVLVGARAAQRRIAELGASRGGPLGGGREWAELESAQIDLMVATVSNTLDQSVVLELRCRAEQAARAGRAADAERGFDRALRAAVGRPTLTLAVLGMAGRRSELRAQTRAFLGTAPDVDSEFAATMWLNAGLHEEAADSLDGGEEMPVRGPRTPADWDACTLRARIAAGRGRLPDAARFADEAVHRFEQWYALLSSDTFRLSVGDDGTVRRLFQVAARTAVAAGDDVRGFAHADRARSLALGALLAEGTGAAAAAASTPLRAWRQARAEWAGAFDRHRGSLGRGEAEKRAVSAQRVREAQDRLDAAANALERVAPGLTSAPRAPVPPVTVADVAAHLDAGTVLLEYVLGDDELLVWAVTATGCRAWRREVEGLAFAGTVNRLHGGWAGDGSDPRAAAATLSEALLGPVATVLAEHPRVLVVPSGPLHLLPFHALPHQGRPLGATHAVSQLPAAASVPRLAGRPRPDLRRGALVVGDPATDPARGLHRLPGAAVEAHAVGSVLDATPLTGDDADEAAVRIGLASGPAIAHLATHGLLDAEAPDLSALVLAGADELTVAELLGLGLDLDLAVLSACDSGRGDITLGGDVVGLTRGLLAAGARHCVVSLWPIDDRAGCLVMAMMAQRLASGEAVAEALAGAQNELRRASAAERDARYAALAAAAGVPDAPGRRRDLAGTPAPVLLPDNHPTWWAPFVHVGV